MSRETLLQSSFNAGAMSQRLVGRSDFKKYGSAVTDMSNVLPLVSGPATFRPGTLYVAHTLSSSTATRMIDFKFNTEQAYVIELGNQQMRFFRNKGVILSETEFTNGDFATGSLSDWTDNSSGTGSASVVSNAANLAGGSSGVGAIYQELSAIGISQYTITADVSGDDVDVKVGTTVGASDIASGTLSTGSGSTFNFTPSTAQQTIYVQFENTNNTTAVIDNITLSNPEYIIDSPYTTAQLKSITYAQDSDVLYFALKSNTIKPKTLQRFGNADWRLIDVDTIDGPYLDTNTDESITLQPSGTTGSGVTITASGGDVFSSTDVGRLLRLRTDANQKWGYAKITGYTSATQVTVDVLSNFNSTAARFEWRLGAFSETTGYPGVITFHEFRLVYANTEANPNFVWLSESQGAGREKVLYAPSENSGTVTDSNSIYFPLTAGDVSNILWMSSGNVLAVGTADSEWVIEAGDVAKAISPTNSRATRRTTHGSLPDVPAVRIDGTVMYAKGTGSRVNRFLFNFTKDKYESINISLLAEHYFRGKKIVDMVYASEPHSVVWILFDDGTLSALTFVDSEEVGGWSAHTIAGTDAFVESIAVIPSQDGTYSELWMTVRRTIDSATVRYVEVMADQFFLNDIKDAVAVDSALQYDGASTTTISGLDHLEGETVSVLGDGAVRADEVVSGGQITLARPVEKATIGLYYEGDIKFLDFDAVNSLNGSSLGQIRRVTRAVLRLFESGLVYMGRADQNKVDITVLEPRKAADNMDTAPALKTGLFEMKLQTQWDLSSRLWVQFRSPLPSTLSAVMFHAQVNEG